MIEFKKGDRVKVARSRFDDDQELIGRSGFVSEEAKFFQGELAVGVTVVLDDDLDDLGEYEFEPDELQSADPDPAADAADAPAPHDLADCTLCGGSGIAPGAKPTYHPGAPGVADPAGWEPCDCVLRKQHDPADCGTCDDHADTQRDADRAEQQLDGAL